MLIVGEGMNISFLLVEQGAEDDFHHVQCTHRHGSRILA